MKRVITDKDGNVVDQNGNIIGMKQGNTVVPYSGQPMSLQDRLKQVTKQKNQEEQKVEKPVKAPSTFIQQYTKYQVTKDSYFVIRFGLYQKQGRIIVVKNEYVEQISQAQSHWVKFRMWTYREQLQWKDKSMKFNNDTRNMLIDINVLNQMKIRNLILDWSFAQKNDKFKLLQVGRYLSDQSYQIFKGFFPTIINSIIDLMNVVLQGNG